MARKRKKGKKKAPLRCRKALSVAMKSARGSKPKMRAAMLSFRACAGW